MTITLTDELRDALLSHAADEAPRECCGLLVRSADTQQLHYMRCANVHPSGGDDRFRIGPAAWAAAEDLGEVVAVVHSHPNASANPSMADRVGCERSGLPWLIVGWPSGVIKEVAPEGWSAPLVGREFSHGVLDCYSIIQDHFVRELSIQLPDFDRSDDWWTRGEDLYMKHFAEAGFVEAQGELRPHDVLLMRIRSEQANHGAVYLGNGVMLHHLWGRLSERTVYGGAWQRNTMKVVRHRSLA